MARLSGSSAPRPTSEAVRRGQKSGSLDDNNNDQNGDEAQGTRVSHAHRTPNPRPRGPFWQGRVASAESCPNHTQGKHARPDQALAAREGASIRDLTPGKVQQQSWRPSPAPFHLHIHVPTYLHVDTYLGTSHPSQIRSTRPPISLYYARHLS